MRWENLVEADLDARESAIRQRVCDYSLFGSVDILTWSKDVNRAN